MNMILRDSLLPTLPHPLFEVKQFYLYQALDNEKGIGETQFHVALSTGTTPVGLKYKAASVKERYSENCTWLTARREGVLENLDGQTILENIQLNEIGEVNIEPTIYVGVRKRRRKCSIGLEKVRWQTFMEFHQVLGMILTKNITGKESVFGGLIFACSGCGEPFFGHPKIDSQPILENFPGVTIAGSFCNGELKHGYKNGYGQEDGGGDSLCSVHVFSTVYLVLSYIPAQMHVFGF